MWALNRPDFYMLSINSFKSLYSSCLCYHYPNEHSTF